MSPPPPAYTPARAERYAWIALQIGIVIVAAATVALWIIAPPAAFAQDAAAEPAPVQGRHGLTTTYHAEPNGLTARGSWQSTPPHILHDNGSYVPHILTLAPDGDRAEYRSAQLNVTIHADLGCSAVLPDGRTIAHRLLAADNPGSDPGPWQIDGPAAAAPCALAIAQAPDGRPRVHASHPDLPGLDYQILYDFAEAELEWTYRLTIAHRDRAGPAYAFNTVLAGAALHLHNTTGASPADSDPPALEGREGRAGARGPNAPPPRDSAVPDQRSADVLPHIPRADLVHPNTTLTWGDSVFDHKDDAHNRTAKMEMLGWPNGPVPLHRTHPHARTAQASIFFTHGLNAAPTQAGDVITVDPSIAPATTAFYTTYVAQAYLRDCVNYLNRNPTTGYFVALPGGLASVGIHGGRCFNAGFASTIPATPGTIATNVTLHFHVTSESFPPAWQAVAYGTHLPSLGSTGALALWRGLLAAPAADGTPITQARPQTLGFPAITPGASIPTAFTLHIDDRATLAPIYNQALRAGGTVAHMTTWDGSSGRLHPGTDSTSYLTFDTTAATNMTLDYERALQPVTSLTAATQTSRPATLNAVQGEPPYAALTVRTNNGTDGLTPTALSFRVREPAAPNAADREWRLAAAYDAEADDADFGLADGVQVSYVSAATDAWADGTHSLHGRGPFAWQVRALYSSTPPPEYRNDIQGPWVNATAGPYALCGLPPAAPLPIDVAAGTTGLVAAWTPPPAAPADQCGTLTYSYVLTDRHGAHLAAGSGLLTTTATITGLTANEPVQLNVTARNQYGTSPPAVWQGRTAASPHAAPQDFTASPKPEALPYPPNTTLLRAGSAVFAWRDNSTLPDPLPPGILRPTEYETYYLRSDLNEPGRTFWQPLTVGSASATWSPGHAYTSDYLFTPQRVGHWNAPAVGFAPAAEYRVKLEPHYSDGTRGHGLYAAYTGPAPSVDGAAIYPARDAAGFSVRNSMTALANVTILVNSTGHAQSAGVQWGASWLARSSPQSAVIATAAYPATTASFSCAPPANCDYLIGGDDISNENLDAFILNLAGDRIEPSAHAIRPAAAPCRESTPAPTSLRAAFGFSPGPTSPNPDDEIGSLNLAWQRGAGANPRPSPDPVACTYSLTGYLVNATGVESGKTFPSYSAAVANASATTHTVPRVHSFGVYTVTVQSNGSAGLSAPASAVIRTPPWPAHGIAVRDYFGPADADTGRYLEIEWQASPHVPFAIDLEYDLLAAPGSAGDSYGPIEDTAWRVDAVPARWDCYYLVAKSKLGHPDSPPPHPQACGEAHAIPDAVTDLRAVSELSSARLTWTPPDANSVRGLTGYVLNWTSPPGEPLRPMRGIDISGNATTVLVHGLPLQTASSLRMAATSYHTAESGRVNITGARIIVVNTTLDFTAGNLDLLNETRDKPTRGPHIALNYTRAGADVTVRADWPARTPAAADIADLHCDVRVPELGDSYTATISPLRPDPDSDGMRHGTLLLSGLGARTAHVDCSGGPVRTSATGASLPAIAGRLQVDPDPAGAGIPFLQWIADFREGRWGTTAQFGAFDLVTLLVVIISMIGFNRSSPALGLIMAVIVLSVAAYFELIVLPTVVLGMLALLVMVAVVITRRGRGDVV